MEAKSPLRLDLNNFFSPAITDGPKNISDLEDQFLETHAGLTVLKKTGQLTFSLLPTDTILLTATQDAAAKYTDLENIVVLGIGGSALGLISLHHALRDSGKNQKIRLHIIDNIDPSLMNDTCQAITGQKNLFIFISKSGETTETLAQYLYLTKRFGKLDEHNTFIITDPKQGYLRQLAKEKKIPSLPVPTGVGGRFSVLSPVGLFPLALLGIDIADILEGAEHGELASRSGKLQQNPAALLAASIHYWIKKGMNHVVAMPYSNRLRYFPDWFAQLWGESLGKKIDLKQKTIHFGSTPLKAVGATDQHSLLQLLLDGPRDKMSLFFNVHDFGTDGLLDSPSLRNDEINYLENQSLQKLIRCEQEATAAALKDSHHPNASLELATINPFQLGQLYQIFMNIIPYIGAFLEINPFDQPAVQRIKNHIFGTMGKNGFAEFDLTNTHFQKRSDLIF